MSAFRATSGLIFALAMLALAAPSSAQQKMAPAAPPVVQQVPVQAQPTTPAPIQAAPPAQAPAAAASTESASPKSTSIVMRELSPWSMFMSADVIVKAVMIGLAFASLVTWTIFIAKMVELSVVQRKLRWALAKISDARSLAEAQFTLGAKEGVLPSLLAASMREARQSAGISSDAGIKERAASSCAEIVRAEGRRIPPRLGPACTIGATSPFVGLFGTGGGLMK